LVAAKRDQEAAAFYTRSCISAQKVQAISQNR
jgi:hypothetical protein